MPEMRTQVAIYEVKVRKSYLKEIIILRVTESVTLIFYNEHLKGIKLLWN